MMNRKTILGASVLAAGMLATAAQADTLTLKPSFDARLRYENVDTPTLDADALTVRLRPGITASTKSGFSVLVEGEATLAIVDHFRTAPFAAANGYAVVADPENIELNRAQFQYKTKAFTLTGGRQRINLDDQRFVGSVGWRQNEQTFDAVRGEATIGPVAFDGTYSWSQRTIFGIDAGPRQAFSGDFFFGGAGMGVGPLKLKAFTYLLDFDESIAVANSSQTYGVRGTAEFKAGKAKLSVMASYATQSDYGSQPLDYKADYVAAEVGLGVLGFNLTGGYEKLGSDRGIKAFQTPLATLHKFNGWADMFLTTPANGLQDYYVSVGKKIALPGLPLNASVAYHKFDSDVGNVKYGHEWDAQIGFKISKVDALIKYAAYSADKFGADTNKLWLQLGWAF